MPEIISSISPFGSPEWELLYGGQRLYPAPLIDFSRSINRNDSDVALSQEDSWKLRGVYLNSPSGCYSDVVTNMDRLKQIFSQDGLEFVIRAGSANRNLPSGTLIVSGIYPFISSISIPESSEHFHKFDYEVTLVSRTAASGVSGVVESTRDSWTYEEDAERATINVNHTVSAVGINTSTSGSASNALTNARTFVVSRLGTTNTPAGFPTYVVPGSGTGSTLYEFQRTRTETVDIEAGSYEVSERFVYVSGVRPFSDTRTYTYDKDSNGIVNITVQGTVQGYPRSDGTKTTGVAFYNAQSGFTNHILPTLGTDASGVYQSYSGSGTLAITNPQSVSIGENRYLGTLTYSYQYTDDPAEVLPSGIVEQSLQVTRKDAIRLYASHVIPHRRLGNILQDIGTPTEGSIQINASAQAENTGDEIADTNRAISHVQDLINQNRPNAAEFITLRLADVSQDHDKIKLTASASVQWIFTIDLAQVNSPNSDIILFPVSP